MELLISFCLQDNQGHARDQPLGVSFQEEGKGGQPQSGPDVLEGDERTREQKRVQKVGLGKERTLQNATSNLEEESSGHVGWYNRTHVVRYAKKKIKIPIANQFPSMKEQGSSEALFVKPLYLGRNFSYWTSMHRNNMKWINRFKTYIEDHERTHWLLHHWSCCLWSLEMKQFFQDFQKDS